MKNAKKTTPKPATPASAAVAYTAKRGDIARLVDVLGMELDKHDERAKADPKNWGFTGNMNKVRSDLIEMVGFLSGMDAETIEKFLDEAE